MTNFDSKQKLFLHFILFFGKLFFCNLIYFDWLAIKLQSVRQCKNLKSYLNYHYIGFNNFDLFENCQKFFSLLQFLVYIYSLDYKLNYLESTDRRLVIFKVQDFLKYQNPSMKSNNYY